MPLLFYGVASLSAVPLYQPGAAELEPNVLAVLGTSEHLRNPEAVGAYWFGVLAAGAFLAEWCQWRARVHDTRPVVIALGLGAVPVVAAFDRPAPQWATSAGVALLALAVVAWRRGTLVGTHLATGAGIAVLVWAHPVVGQFVVLGAGLFAYSTGVRDNALRTTVGAFAVAVCLSATFTPVGTGSAWALASPVLLPGAVLVIGGLVGLRPAVRQERVAVT